MMARTGFKALLLGATALQFAFAAHAQDSGAGAGVAPAGEGDEVVVTGTRASLSRSLGLKRDTAGILDAISSEDMGKFPDQNVAESLQRVTGVSIDRSAGEGRFITVRGFGPEFNTVLYNGRLLATENDGREFSFDILPPELISTAAVYKSSSADLQEGGIGSTVVLTGARPLDQRGFHAAGSMAGKYDSGSKKVTPSGSFLISDTNRDGTFGVLASFVYDKRKGRLERFSSDGWLTNQSLDYNQDGIPDATGVAITRSYNQQLDLSTRTRKAGTLAVDWKPSDVLTLKLDGLYSRYKIDNENRILAYFSDPADIQSATINDHGTVTHYVRRNTGGLASDFVVSELPRDATTYQLGGNLKWTPTDRLSLTTDLSYSNAHDDNGGKEKFFVVGIRNVGTNPTFDLRPGQDTPLYTNVLSPTDPTNLRSHYFQNSGNDVRDKIGQARLDGEYRLGGVFTKLKFGGLYTDRKKISTNYLSPGEVGCNYYCGYNLPLPASIVSVYDAKTFLSGTGLPTQWLSFDPDQLAAYLVTPASYNQPPKTPAEVAAYQAALARNGGDLHAILDPRGSGSEHERSWAFYGQLEFAGDLGDHTWSGQAGVRWLRTDLTSKGTDSHPVSIDPIPNDPTNLVVTYSDPEPVSVRNHYDYFLPSATFKLDLSRRLVFRAAGSRTLTRPTLTDLGVTQSLDIRPPASFFGSGGNPLLKPYLAWNADLGLDFYINKTSYLSVAGYYKWISNFVSSATVPEDILGRHFLITRPVNANDAKVSGLEFAAQYTFDMLPAPFDGLGASANYTKVHSSVTFDPSLTSQVFNVEGLSDSANAVLFYEKGPIQFRVAYNWRAPFLRRTFSDQGQPENVHGYGQWDASASIALTHGVSVFAEAVNITNARTRSYQSYTERVLRVEQSGRRITAGVRARF